MKISEAIESRRTIKRFTDRKVTREEIEKLLDSAVKAPNHRLTQPWRFYVLGPEARHAYGLALGNRKAKKQTDPEKAETLRQTVAREHQELPAMIAVAVVNSDNPEIAQEDYAATMMGIQNMQLTALEMGLGLAIRTGAVMDDPAARAAVGLPDDQKIVAVVNVGAPSDVPSEPARQPASAMTTWVP
jgi:nitroreductase